MTDPDQLTPILDAKLRSVSGAIVNKPPLCSGTWEVPSESFQLFFKTEGNSARWLDLLNATESELGLLANACAPATLGADNKDVLTWLTAGRAKWMLPTLCRGLMQTD